MTDNLILIFHVLVALAIIGLILLQQGKGAEAGASFGAGASQTIFGSSGSWNFFSKMTAVLATVFFITSLGLAVIAKNNAAVTSGDALPGLVEVPAESEVPVVEDIVDISDDEIPEAATEQIEAVEDELEKSTEDAQK